MLHWILKTGFSVPPSFILTYTKLLYLIYLWPFIWRVLCLQEMKMGKRQKPSAALLMKISVKQISFPCNPPLEQQDMLILKNPQNLLTGKPKYPSFVFFYCTDRYSDCIVTKRMGKSKVQQKSNKT